MRWETSDAIATKEQERVAGSKIIGHIGVVASEIWEVLVERVLPETECQFRHQHRGLKASVRCGGSASLPTSSSVAQPGGVSLSVNDGVRVQIRSPCAWQGSD